jgi:quercetin 2,3-dioxygenase
MLSVLKLHKAQNAPIGDLVTFRALPTHSVDMIDPFLFLNHHGPQVYRPHNQGLPFGPHPHRGMETVTSQQEIMEAYADYRKGLFGTWKS